MLRFARRVHTVPTLKSHPSFATAGIQGLFSPAGFNQAWSQYQEYLTTNLTLHTNGTENETRSPYQIILLTAKQTTNQHVFHYALQAHHNHFFFEQLADKETASQTRPSRFIMERLADLEISNADELKTKIVKASNSVLGQGWVYLVEKADKSLAIETYNNDGTPFFHGKNQSVDLNGPISSASLDHVTRLKARSNDLDFTLPLLAISLWDVSYMHDYGVNGRREYLDRVWECINWDVVNKRLFQL